MKRLVSAFAAIALGVALAPQALAATTVQGGPLTGLSLASSTNIHLSLTGYPTTKGLYIVEAVKPMAGSRPSTSGTALWVSAAAADIAQHATPINGDLVLTVDNGHSWGADCAHQQCGIFIRLDHNSPGDLSEDHFIPLSFDVSTAAATSAPTQAALPNDTLDVTVGGGPVPLTLAYETPITFNSVTGSGTPATYKSYTPDLCPLTGNSVNALKGAGVCDIGITAPGDATHGAVTKHFPLNLVPATQSIAATAVSVKVGKSVALTATTAFGEKITYVASSKNCSVKGVTVKGVKAGSCSLAATAAGTANYSALDAKVVVTVKK